MQFKSRLARENATEKRALRRFQMNLPARVRVPGIPSEFAAETENISARGIFFQIDRWMNPGVPIEITMDFPSQVTLADPVRVKFQARVLRVEPRSDGTSGVAAAIEEYQLQGQMGATIKVESSAIAAG